MPAHETMDNPINTSYDAIVYMIKNVKQYRFTHYSKKILFLLQAFVNQAYSG